MSNPSGKPFEPFDLSAYAPRRARERSVLDPAALDPAAVASDEDNNDNSSDNEGRGGGDQVGAGPLPYAARAALRPEVAVKRPVDLDLDGGDRSQSPPKPQSQPKLQSESRPRPAPSDRPVAAEAAAEEAGRDVDLARLESSLLWLQREGAVGRLPRAIQLPPVSGLRPVSPEGTRARSEQFINGIRVPPSLAPERLRPPPVRERRNNLRGPLRILLAGMIAAPIAYYFSIGNLPLLSRPAHESESASLASRLVASTEFPIPKDKLRPSEAEDYNMVVSSRNRLAAQTNASAQNMAPAARVEIPAAAPASPDPAPNQVAPAGKPVRELDPEAVKLLMQQGEQFLASGDLVTARLVFRRAAESGNAAAALALGATYDPVVLARLGVRGMGADVEKARSWYEKAKEFGSPDAPRRLETLANR
jgi:TPR repeat protein